MDTGHEKEIENKKHSRKLKLARRLLYIKAASFAKKKIEKKYEMKIGA